MKKRIYLRTIFWVILIILDAQVAVGQQECSYEYINQRLISISMEPIYGAIYVDDGAADGSIFDIENENIKELMACGGKIFKPLIASIDNTNKSNNCYRTNRIAQVSVGLIAVDILLHSIGYDEDIVVVDCEDDGLGNCYKDAYYLRPEEYYDKNGNLTDKVYTLKRNWERAYKAGKFGFVYPQWAEEDWANYAQECKRNPKTCAPSYLTGVINDKKGFANVRCEPSTKGKIIRKIYDKQEFKYLVNNCIDWWAVLNPDGTYGYMHNSKIREVETPK